MLKKEVIIKHEIENTNTTRTMRFYDAVTYRITKIFFLGICLRTQTELLKKRRRVDLCRKLENQEEEN